MIEVYNHRLFVSEEDIDMVGHVNNVVYLKWMQDAALAHSSQQGWPAERYQERGAGWVARLHQIEYLQPAFPGDCVVVQTWVSDMKKVTSTRRYRIFRLTEVESSPGTPATDTNGVDSANQLLAVAHTQWAFIDFSSRQPKRIPPEIANAYRVIEHP
jgi:acyl-CoA thioester hydrolase